MSGTFVWVCICILDGGHFSFQDVDADPGTVGLALTFLVTTSNLMLYLPQILLILYFYDYYVSTSTLPLCE